MSWFSLPLTNPFKSDDGDGGTSPAEEGSDPNSSGMKDDLSAISQTFTHHLRGVAAFLAPAQTEEQTPVPSSSEKLSGVKNDLVEIGDSFKSGLSLFSSKLASSFLQFGDEHPPSVRENAQYSDGDGDEEEEEEEEEEEIAGVTDEIVDFVCTISERPQLWTDFPLSLPSDFAMSDSQKEHVASIEQFVPGLESLRQQVCHELSDGQFWMIYFVLLLPRLNPNDLELLSTPEIAEVRETLLQQLQSKKNAQMEASKDSETVDASEKDVKVSGQQESVSKFEKYSSAETADGAQDEGTLHGEKPQQQLEDQKGKNAISYADKQSENEEDVSFSDLEDDDTDLSDRLQGTKPTHSKKVSSSSESHEWIQLNENSRAQGSRQKAGQSKDSEGDESNDWLTVDDIDLDSLAAN